MNWRRSVIALLVVIPIIAVLAYGLTRDPRELPSTLPGRPAPEFALEVMDSTGPGRIVRLSDLRGQVVVLNFWASWCLACRDEHAALSAVAEAYADEPVKFFGVLYNDKPENAFRWIERMGGQSYPTLLDPGSRMAIDYGLYGVPETFFVSPDGRVAYKHVGPVTEALLVQTIEEILAGSAPEVTS